MPFLEDPSNSDPQYCRSIVRHAILPEEDLIEVDAALEKALDKDEMRTWLKERGHEVPEEIEGAEEMVQAAEKKEE